jgi:trk system potassium uptake protein TrkH
MMILTYSSITLLSFILLMITGMGWFDALTHAMSACSTCGFSTKNSSIAYFDSPLIEAVLIFSMLSGAVNFTLLYSTIVPGRHKRSYILKSEIFRAFLILIAVAVVMNTISLRINNEYSSLSETFRQAVFQTVSLATTTGFATTDTNVWPGFCIGVLIFSSLICGCAGSTSGGIKVDRLVLVAKGTHYQIQRLKKPSQVIHSRLEGKFRKPDEIVQAEIFILLYLGLIFTGATLNLALGMDPRSGISAAIACMGNVGPGFGEVGSIGNYSDLPDTLKISNTILMLAGRLEIYPIVLAFRNRI